MADIIIDRPSPGTVCDHARKKCWNRAQANIEFVGDLQIAEIVRR